MSLEIDKNMCRICMKTNDGTSIWSDSGIIKKIQFCTQLVISKTDDLPKIICNKCVGRLEIAYDFRKQAECSDKYLRRVVTHQKEENQSALGKQGLYDEMVLEIYRTRIKVEQDDQIEQLTYFESEEVSNVNISPTLEGINCKGTERLTDSAPMYPVVGEYGAADKVKIEEIEVANIEKIQETKQINLFTIAKVISIPKTEFNQTNEITGKESCSQEDIESLSDDTQIKVEPGDQMKQPTDVKPVTISETIEEDIQYKGSSSGANIAQIEKLQEKIFTIAKVSSIRKNEDDQNDKLKCMLCGAYFTQKGSLNRHLLIHSGERPHKCNSCDRSFAVKCHLTRHMMLHSGEKPYICETCGLPFRHQNTLKRHVLTKHENQKKAEVKRIVLKQNEQYRRRRQLQLARETPEDTALRKQKECARMRQRYRAKQRQRSNEL